MNTYRAVQYWYIRAPHYIQSCISELLNTFRAVYPSTYIHTVQSCTVPVNPGTSIHKDLYIRAPQYIQSIYIRAPQYIQSCISEHLHTYSELYTVQYNTAYPSTPAHTVQYGDLSENSIVQYIYPSRLTHTCSTEIYPRTLLYIQYIQADWHIHAVRRFIRELYCTYIQADRHIHAVRRFIRDLYCTYMIQADWHIHAVWRFIREPQDTCTVLSVLVCILSSTSPTLYICCTVYRLHCISAALYSKSMLHCKSAALNNTSTCINPLLGSYKCLFAAL